MSICIYVCVSPFLLHSQTAFIGDTYFCGFEDPIENANWVRNSTTTANKWEFGTAQKNGGEHGMYVSFDGGATAGCSNEKNFITVYREFNLTPDVYDVSFDWKNPGYGSGELYVCWIPTSQLISPLASPTDISPTWLKSWVRLEVDSVMRGSTIWQNTTFSANTAGGPYKLLFFWKNTGGSKHPSGMDFPAGCIDNVQIRNKYNCPRPTNLKYTRINSTQGKYSWNGGAGPFEIEYKSNTDDYWSSVSKDIYDEEILVRPLQKGSYVVRIRSTCGTDTSTWSIFHILVHYSSENCIDFLNINDHTVCTTYSGDVELIYKNKNKVIDYGFASSSSRHTIHYLNDDYDANTNYGLKCIPPDGMPSIRLGNELVPVDRPEQGGEAIIYTYTVSEDAPLLLIKYAVVLEAPGHIEKNQPFFQINITDGYGNPSTEFMCGEVEFYSDPTAPGWNEGAGRVDSNGDLVVAIWKDWSTVGLNLQNMVGQTIQIEFITRDCTQTGHFGYAYFTMDCMSAKVSGIGCGDNMFGKIEAPDGFKYKWYPDYLQNTPELEDYFNDPLYGDTLKEFSPLGGPDDTGTYICRVIAIEDESCYFELEANLDPRDVYAEFDYVEKFENCKAEIEFSNHSYTLTRNGQLKGLCEQFEWYINDEFVSYDENPTMTFTESGTYEIKLIASISDGLCLNADSINIYIPEIKPYRKVDAVQFCIEDPEPFYNWEGRNYPKTKSTKDSILYKSIYGCDSLRVLEMTIDTVYEKKWDERITTEDDYYFFGKKLEESGIYRDTVPGRGNDCDSIYILHLSVDTILRVNFNEEQLPLICSGSPDFPIFYESKIGTIFGYSLYFDAKAEEAGFTDMPNQPHVDGEITVPLLSNIRPDRYSAQLIFHGNQYDNDTIDFKFNVLYPSTILAQKWDDVIAVLNSNQPENDGYEFSAFGWYLNYEEIPGETKSYLYQPLKLLLDGEYQALLTRSDDGVSMFTCPFIPDPYAGDITVYPTILSAKDIITIKSNEGGEGILWDLMGNQILTVNLKEDITQFQAPNRKGVYVLKIQSEELNSSTYRILVK